MPGLGCISESDLRAFLLGDLPERIARTISAHLEACPECDAVARRLDDSTDPLIDHLRRAFDHGEAAGVALTVDERGLATADRRPAVALPQSVDGYEVIEEIGRGGTSVVYLARQSQPARLVALKVLVAGAHAGAERRARFRAEADAFARLRHQHIVQIHQVGEHDGLPYLALEYVEGGSLAQRLGGSPLPPRQAAELVAQVAEAVDFAHRSGVVHRDLKPSNVLMSGDGSPRVTDFGLAKQEQSELTATGAVLGTPSYMAPEQAEGKAREVGPAADVYALGAILYELLTGRPPFRGATPMETLEQVRSQDPVPPGRLQGRMPRDLDTICLKCLQKPPAARYASARALTDDLRRFLDDQPIRARRVGALGVAWRWCRRNRTVAALLLVLGILLSGGGVGSLLAALRFQRLARAETVARERADRHAAEARAVTDFLINEMLGAAHPRTETGRTITVDQVLTRAGRAIDGRFADQPLVEASIRYQIAQAYISLGIGRQVVEHAARARDLRTRHLGPEHPETLAATALLAWGLQDTGAFGSALAPAEEVYRVRLRTLGPDHLATAEALYWVAHCIGNDPARLDEARSMFERAIAVYRRTLPEGDYRLTGAIEGLAHTLGMRGRHAESLALYDDLLRIHRRHRGPEAMEVDSALLGKAEVLKWSGRREEAGATYEEVLRRLSRVQDPGFYHLYRIMDALIDVRREQAALRQVAGRRAEAERLIHTKALPICDRRVARAEAWLARDPGDSDARSNLVGFLAERAAFLAEWGRPAQALEDVDRAFALGGDLLSPTVAMKGDGRGADGSSALAPESAHGDWALAQMLADQGTVSLCRLARVYALLARSCRDDGPRSDRCGDRAVELFRQAVDRGYRRKKLVLQTPGFTFLKRSRADFRAILDGLPRRVEGAIEGEVLKVAGTSAPFKVAPQALPENRYVGRWSGDAILIGSPGRPGDWVELALPVPEDGTYRVAAHLIKAPGHGVVRITIDGGRPGTLFDGFQIGPDPRSPSLLDRTPAPVATDLGIVSLRKGTATIRIEVVGKNAGSWGYSWGLDCIVLRRPSDPSRPEGDLPTESTERPIPHRPSAGVGPGR
jgi:tetratricopeptide (TPR) repeat protein